MTDETEPQHRAWHEAGRVYQERDNVAALGIKPELLLDDARGFLLRMCSINDVPVPEAEEFVVMVSCVARAFVAGWLAAESREEQK